MSLGKTRQNPRSEVFLPKCLIGCIAQILSDNVLCFGKKFLNYVETNVFL